MLLHLSLHGINSIGVSYAHTRSSSTRPEYRDLAQFGSASALGAEGRRFESCNPDHK